MSTPITKGVIPAAGLGTRFLPATKAMPKEMLPVVDKPAIQYVVEEAAAAGLTDLLMVTGRNKNALENHFDRMTELEALLEQKGDHNQLEKVRHATRLADIHYVRQGDPLGLGHAVLRAKMHVGNQPFAVLLGDDLIDARDPLLEKMLVEQGKRNASIIALMEVDPSQIHLYGAAAVEATDDPDVVRVTGLLEHTKPGKGNEIQLTDALQEMALTPETTGGVYGVIFRGRRYDTGDRLDYIKAIVQLAVDREDLGPGLRPWLHEFVATLGKVSE
jgi:UTP--glucose-1-phosphate uridylyltransferase